MLRPRAIAVLVVAGAAGTAAPAVAEPEAIGLQYSVAAGCPDQAVFVAAIQARASAVVAIDGARLFMVAIPAAADGAPVTGTLTIFADGAETTRELTGATCAETVDALALAAALAIEDQAAAAPPVVPPPVVPVDVDPPSVVTRAATTRSWHVSAGAGAARFGGITPGGVFAVAVNASLGRDRGPRFRIGVARSERDDIATATGSADLRATLVRLDACPIALVRGRFDAAPCAGVELGALTAHGADVTMATGDTRPWVAPDAALRLRARSGRFAIELEGAVAFPLIRDRFVILPSTTVHEVPAVTTTVGLGITVDLR
jgi:hypothetical protein